jgi:hypothetical protein
LDQLVISQNNKGVFKDRQHGTYLDCDDTTQAEVLQLQVHQHSPDTHGVLRVAAQHLSSQSMDLNEIN